MTIRRGGIYHWLCVIQAYCVCDHPIPLSIIPVWSDLFLCVWWYCCGGEVTVWWHSCPCCWQGENFSSHLGNGTLYHCVPVWQVGNFLHSPVTPPFPDDKHADRRGKMTERHCILVCDIRPVPNMSEGGSGSGVCVTPSCVCPSCVGGMCLWTDSPVCMCLEWEGRLWWPLLPASIIYCPDSLIWYNPRHVDGIASVLLLPDLNPSLPWTYTYVSIVDYSNICGLILFFVYADLMETIPIAGCYCL